MSHTQTHTHLLQLLLGLRLHPPDVLHGQLHPAVDPAKQLPVEVGEDAFLLLRRGGEEEREEEGEEDEGEKE